MSKLVLSFVVCLMVASYARADVKVEKMEYKGWRNSYRVSNGEVELVVTGDVGPRVIRFGLRRTPSNQMRGSGRSARPPHPVQVGKNPAVWQDK